MLRVLFQKVLSLTDRACHQSQREETRRPRKWVKENKPRTPALHQQVTWAQQEDAGHQWACSVQKREPQTHVQVCRYNGISRLFPCFEGRGMNCNQGYRIRKCSNQFGEVAQLGEKTWSEKGSNTAPFPVMSLSKPVLCIQAYKVCCISSAVETGLCSTDNSSPATHRLLPRATITAAWLALQKEVPFQGVFSEHAQYRPIRSPTAKTRNDLWHYRKR